MNRRFTTLAALMRQPERCHVSKIECVHPSPSLPPFHHLFPLLSLSQEPIP